MYGPLRSSLKELGGPVGRVLAIDSGVATEGPLGRDGENAHPYLAVCGVRIRRFYREIVQGG